jgi:two-component system response regulator AtoC
MAELIDFHGMRTVAPNMQAVFARLERVARTESTVLIRGQTGTGKELAARALHRLGRRAQGPFRAINCSTLTPELLASELFGHVKGAFTGAFRDREGLFALADGGTVFLDEVAEAPASVQAQLLRVLQERTFVPVGGSKARQVDVRIISATNKALRRAVQARRFREDLMYRLRVVPLFLPPLSERDGDIEALAAHFVTHFNSKGGRHIEGIQPAALELMLAYDWPGNIRELRNVIECAFAVGEHALIGVDDLPPELRGEPPDADSGQLDARGLERRRLVEALRRSRGRKAQAAEWLGISRSTLWRRMREHDL